jgi:hypothetical protein
MRNIRLGFVCFLATLLIAVVAGCGQETAVIPSVTSATPAQGAVNVAVNTAITATFSEAMATASISASTFTVTGPGGAVAGTVTYSGTTATFTPTANLAFSTLYTATITTGATSPGGTPMALNSVWTFTTITPPPTVSPTAPLNNAVNVPIGQALSATFSEAMAPATISTSTFTLTGPGGAVAGTVAYAGLVATFTPSASLAYSTSYTATITNGATSLAGTPLAANSVWTFTTITPPPTVKPAVPLNNAVNVPIGQALSATFSEAMAPATISTSTFTLTGPGGAVTGTVTYAGLVATFTPSASLAYSTTYTATITNGATSLAGTPLAASTVWTFTTITPPPAVVSTTPVNAATGVLVSQVLSATFNEAMTCATLASPATTFTVTGPGATPVAGTVNCAGAVATFTPGATLAVNTLFTATIATGAKDLAGTPLTANYAWVFKTAPAPTPPTVIATVPANLAPSVATNSALTATFGTAMNPATIDAATFTLTSAPGAVAVTGTVTYAASGSVATFTPAANLAPSTVFTATITTGAMDVAGTALAQNYVWTFTTAAGPIITPPTVLSTIPLLGASSVPLNQIVSATFSKAMNPATITTITPPTFTLTYVASGGVTTPVAGLVAYAAIGDTLTFTPAANLAPSTLFTATITTGAQDLTGTALASNYVWTFTTGTVLATTPPELVSTVPANAAIKVPLNQAISATFTEAMDPLSITTASFQLTQGITPIAGTVSYDAINFIATFTPTSPLLASKVYTATVTNGATSATGIPLGTSPTPPFTNPWNFTTGAAVVPPPIVLGGTIALFGGASGGAGMTNTGISTVIHGDAGTTATGFSNFTGFHDDTTMLLGVAQCVYTETPLAVGLVTGKIYSPLTPAVPFACPLEGTPATILVAQTALGEAQTAYTTLQGLPSTGVLAAELGSTTIYPGVYTNASSVGITAGDLTLDAQGDPNASWVFQIGSTLTIGEASAVRNIILTGGAKASNIYWAVGTNAYLNAAGGGTIQGTIIASGFIHVSTVGNTIITTIDGRLISLNASTTLVNTVINVP